MSDRYWQAVARTRDLGHAPLQVIFQGRPIVLFRAANAIAALEDRCPHRLAELSKGRVTENANECPYHGWRFDPSGACTAIPGCLTTLPKYRVPRFAVTEKAGGIFVAKDPIEDAPYVHVLQGQNCVLRVVKSATRSTLVDAAENILGATHTHFTHKGLLRGLSAKRYRVKVAVTAGEDWVQASYQGEAQQHGLISGLLEGRRVKTIGRYRHPGIAELEYWGRNGLVLATTFHLRQVDAQTVEGIGWLAGPRNSWLDPLKALAFQPMFKIALEQDRRVLKSSFENARGDKPPQLPRSYEIEL